MLDLALTNQKHCLSMLLCNVYILWYSEASLINIQTHVWEPIMIIYWESDSFIRIFSIYYPDSKLGNWGIQIREGLLYMYFINLSMSGKWFQMIKVHNLKMTPLHQYWNKTTFHMFWDSIYIINIWFWSLRDRLIFIGGLGPVQKLIGHILSSAKIIIEL